MLSHEHEAGGVDERVFAFVVPAEPAQGALLLLLADAQHGEPGAALHDVEKVRRGSMPDASTEVGPGFTAYLIRGHEVAIGVGSQQRCGISMMTIAAIACRDPERRIHEDNR